MTIQMTDQAVDKFDPDPAIQEWFKRSNRKRRSGIMESEPKVKRNFRQLNYQWLVLNVWRDYEEHSKSAEKRVTGQEEDAEETHDEEMEDHEEEDVMPNFEIDYDNGEHKSFINPYNY